MKAGERVCKLSKLCKPKAIRTVVLALTLAVGP